MRHIRGSKGGTGIAELGPALFILIIVILIPIMDMLYLAMSYAAGWYLNHLCTRECAVHDPTSGAAIQSAVQIADTAWKKSMLCGLAQASNATTTEKVTYYDNSGGTYNSTLQTNGTGIVISSAVNPAPAPTGTSYVVTAQVVTTIPVKPLFVVPFIGSVPGLSAVVDFNYSGQRPQEEKGIK